MDGSSFDRIARRLAVTTNRRGGIAAIVAGALGIAGISSAEARLELPPRCRNAGSPCQTGDVCCSGRCSAKADGSMRCTRTTTNRPEKKKKKKDKADSGCDGSPCQIGDVCCQDFICISLPSSDRVCKRCGDAGDLCDSNDQCCSGNCSFNGREVVCQ